MILAYSPFILLVAVSWQPSEPQNQPKTLKNADDLHLTTLLSSIYTIRCPFFPRTHLADLAGKVSVTVRADSAEGFDKGKLQNGVLEPLRESDLIE